MKEKIKYYCKKNTIIVWLYKFIRGFVYEYLSNHIINHIPNEMIRWLYYRYILGIRIDSSAYIQMDCYVYTGNGSMNIGKNSIINRGCVLDKRCGLEIGSNVNISPYVQIYTLGHDYNSPEFIAEGNRTIISNRAWLGTRCMIMPGVTVGEGAFVLPGAVVTKDVAPYEVVGGVPARHVKTRNKELLYELSWRQFFG